MWNNSHYKQRFENAHKMRAQQSGIAAKVKVIFFLKLAAKFQIYNTQPRIAMFVERYSSPSTFWEPTREKHTYESQKLPSSTWRLCIEQTRSCSMYSWNRSQGHPRSSYTSLFIYFLCCIFIWQQKTKPERFELKPQHGQQRCIIGVARTLLDHAIAQAEELLAEADHIFQFQNVQNFEEDWAPVFHLIVAIRVNKIADVPDLIDKLM